MKTRIAIVALLLLVPSLNADAEDKPDEWVSISIEVLDAEYEPAAGITVAGLWGCDGYFGDEDHDGQMIALRGKSVTNAEGLFSTRVRRSDRPVAFMAYNEDQTQGALAVIDTNAYGGNISIDVTLEPLITIKGEFHCETIGGAPQWATNYVYAYNSSASANVRVATCALKEGAFECKLPPGDYGISHFGKELITRWSDITLEEDAGVHDFGKLEFEPTAIAANYGKPLPGFEPSGVYGEGELPTLETFTGRWTFLIYFAYW